MTHPWQAEREIDLDLATRLIEAQFPQLAPASLRHFAEGWDNRAYLVNSRYIFRFPRRTLAVALLKTEMAVLGELSQHLPVAIPNPLFRGKPSGEFPWPFAGYERLPGQTACQANLTMAERHRLAKPLAQFLAALHAQTPSQVQREHLPRDTFGRSQIDRLKTKIKANADDLGGQLAPSIRQRIQAVLSSHLAFEANTETLVHGDLYVRHLLIGEHRQLCGVIDWGDIHLGDPSLDLTIAWTFLPPSAHHDFHQNYGRIDDASWAFAKLRALHYGLVLKKYGQHLDDGDLVRESDYIFEFWMTGTSA